MLPRIGYSQTLSITEVQRDSIYNKIERGKMNAERVVHLKAALAECDLSKKLKDDLSLLQEKQLSDKDKIIANNNEAIKNLEDSMKAEKKRARKKGFWGFIKGVGVGIAVTTIGIISI